MPGQKRVDTSFAMPAAAAALPEEERVALALVVQNPATARLLDAKTDTARAAENRRVGHGGGIELIEARGWARALDELRGVKAPEDDAG